MRNRQDHSPTRPLTPNDVPGVGTHDPSVPTPGVPFQAQPATSSDTACSTTRPASSCACAAPPAEVSSTPELSTHPAAAPLASFTVTPHVDADLVIIGGGSAGFAAAIEARELGARVIMVERGTIGGTCANVGCVPSKFLLRAAELAHAAHRSPYHGVRLHLESIDLAAHRAQKEELLAALRREKYEELIDFYGWELVRGEAHFVDPATIEVDGQRIRGRAYLIATGARPALPTLPGLADIPYLTSTTALELERLPASLLVLGAGYVALELGQAFQRLGSAVLLLQRRPLLLPQAEPELTSELRRALEAEGMIFQLGVQPLRVERANGQVRLQVLDGGRERWLAAEALLVATGRQPNTETLALDRGGIAVDPRGAPVIDATLRTTNPRVFAAGDVTLHPQFVYVAAAEGRLAARNALLDEQRAIDLSAVPWVIFSDPQFAAVGLSREEAERAGYATLSGFVPAPAIARERVNLQPFGGVVLVADGETERVLGVQAVASAAGELIEAATLAVANRLTVSALRDHFAPYLTSAEGLRLAALAVQRDVTRLSCCA